MNRILPLTALALALGLAVPAHAETPSAERDLGFTVLRLSESAEKQIRRDRLHATLRVEATGTDASRLQSDVNRRMAAAVERARAVASVKAETTSYSIWQERPQNAPMRWHASQSLALTGRDAGELLKLVGELQGDGLLLGGLDFELTPEAARTAQDELTQVALLRLRERAERIAQEMGLSIARFRDVRVGNAVGDRPRPPIAARAATMSYEAAPPVAEPGDATVDVTVEAEILLAPGDASDPRRP